MGSSYFTVKQRSVGSEVWYILILIYYDFPKHFKLSICSSSLDMWILRVRWSHGWHHPTAALLYCYNLLLLVGILEVLYILLSIPSVANIETPLPKSVLWSLSVLVSRSEKRQRQMNNDTNIMARDSFPYECFYLGVGGGGGGGVLVVLVVVVGDLTAKGGFHSQMG